MTIDQIMIFIFSGGSIFFISGKRPVIGFTMGLLGQPFWFYTAIKNGQGAIMLLALWYTYCHLRGMRREWAKRKGEKKLSDLINSQIAKTNSVLQNPQ